MKPAVLQHNAHPRPLWENLLVAFFHLFFGSISAGSQLVEQITGERQTPLVSCRPEAQWGEKKIWMLRVALLFLSAALLGGGFFLPPSQMFIKCRNRGNGMWDSATIPPSRVRHGTQQRSEHKESLLQSVCLTPLYSSNMIYLWCKTASVLPNLHMGEIKALHAQNPPRAQYILVGLP